MQRHASQHTVRKMAKFLVLLVSLPFFLGKESTYALTEVKVTNYISSTTVLEVLYLNISMLC